MTFLKIKESNPYINMDKVTSFEFVKLTAYFVFDAMNSEDVNEIIVVFDSQQRADEVEKFVVSMIGPRRI